MEQPHRVKCFPALSPTARLFSPAPPLYSTYPRIQNTSTALTRWQMLSSSSRGAPNLWHIWGPSHLVQMLVLLRISLVPFNDSSTGLRWQDVMDKQAIAQTSSHYGHNMAHSTPFPRGLKGKYANTCLI